MAYREVVGIPDLRTFWLETVREHGESSCEEMLSRLRKSGRTPKGESHKARIRNVYSAASSHPDLVKTAPGRFGLR